MPFQKRVIQNIKWSIYTGMMMVSNRTMNSDIDYWWYAVKLYVSLGSVAPSMMDCCFRNRGSWDTMQIVMLYRMSQKVCW